jgi:RHS repeat-associated protein
MKRLARKCVSCTSIFAFKVLILAMLLFSSGSSAALAHKTDGTPVSLGLPAAPTAEELFRSHVFEEPLVPVGGEPGEAENADLAAALRGYAKRNGPDDFASLTRFLERHPGSPWAAALLADLGLEYYNTAHYSLALQAWQQVWTLGQNARSARAKALTDRAGGELACMYARLGRMTELETFLNSVEGRGFIGAATEKITAAREGLWNMKNRPQTSFRCGPLALHRIKLAVDPQHPETEAILASASSQNGFSLVQVAELSKKVGLDYQMGFREPGAAFVVPSVVHWKVGHYAALIRREGDRYLLEDPTFQNDTWATGQALEAETSGYFLIPPGPLPVGWRPLGSKEGESVWGKGQTQGNDPGPITRRDIRKGPVPCAGMAVAGAHLMTVNLNLADQPVGYTPPVGPPVRFTIRYNQRDAAQPANSTYLNLGHKWTCDWLSYITDNPQNSLANVNCYMDGGGVRTFTGFNTNTQSFDYQQYDQTLLTRLGTNSYQMLWPGGSKFVFAQSDGSIGNSRKVFLTQIADPQGNTLSFTYDTNLLLVAVTDAIGQVTTLTYGLPAVTTNGGTVPADLYKLTRVTDPFGRSASFEYVPTIVDWHFTPVCVGTNPPVIISEPILEWFLSKVTDVLGMDSQFNYAFDNLGFCAVCPNNINIVCRTNVYQQDFITSLVTPYGSTSFARGGSGTTRWLETLYPDGSRDRVEYNQTVNVPTSDPPATVPSGMGNTVPNGFLEYRNTFYWSRNACATSYGDYTKARLYHWLHHTDGSSTAGILESSKEPLERRVWYDYPGQSSLLIVGRSNRPSHIGRVLDDGSTQLYTYAYNGFGHLTNMIDPVGRTFSFVYDTNRIDLIEVRMTRAGKSELLSRMTWNGQHRPVTRVDAAGQTNTYTYNARGQLLTVTNPKGETTAFTYDQNGFFLVADGPLPGTNDTVTFTYDAFGRPHSATDVSGYTLSFDYDAMDRPSRVTYPDSTFRQYTYDRLDLTALRDRAARTTSFEHDNMRQLRKVTDPLLRSTLFQWCSCGDIKTLIDPMGRTTTWEKDVQGRLLSKQYSDGSRKNYIYENTTARVRQVVDEKLQTMSFSYNRDNTFSSIAYGESAIATPNVAFTYDSDYERVTAVTDGGRTTLYSYNPITSSPVFGAGRLAGVDGPVANDTITYGYDELGRVVTTAINGVTATRTFDSAGRIVARTNALGSFTYVYDGSSRRLMSRSFPNGLTKALSYGGISQDFGLQQISYAAGANPVSQFVYGQDVSRGRITTWSQQAGVEPPSRFTFGYDDADQLTSATMTNAGNLINSFAYTYDPSGNRLTEQVGTNNYTATYNTLNQLSTTTAPGFSRTNEWDAANRLVAVSSGNARTEFTYDGQSRVVGIRKLLNGIEVSHRLFVWNDNRLSEERATNGVVTKRFFAQGVQFVAGTNAGAYFYTRDHLGSIRELTDSAGNVRARYAYDPYGRRTKISGDLDSDFGFAGMFWASEANLSLTHFRAYDPALGRWLSRDPLKQAEMRQGPNLYAYVRNEPISRFDPEGLCESSICACFQSGPAMTACAEAGIIRAGQVAAAGGGAGVIANELQEAAPAIEAEAPQAAQCIQTVVGYAGGPGVEPAIGFAETLLPKAVQTVQGVAPALNNAASRLADLPVDLSWQNRWDSAAWYVNAMNDWRWYLTPLFRTDYEAARGFSDNLDLVSKIIFGLW